MSLLNPALLWWLGLATIPILLHLLLRSKPKKLLFPALRLLAQRKRNNTRRMRLKHLWLLLLRIAVIGLVVLALTRPSLPAANYAFSPWEWAALAGIVVVAVGAYYALLFHWRRQRLAHHELSYRRSLLRGGTALVALLAFLALVAWPYQRRIRAEITSPNTNVAENLPVAAVMLFDASLSMGYLHEGSTRLERSSELAVEHLAQLPPGSRVAVTHTGTDQPVRFQADRGSAKARIGKLEPSAAAMPLNERLRAALRMQEEDIRRTKEEQSAAGAEAQDRYLREIYVFTDLARSAWNENDAGRLAAALEELETVRVYLVDVGVERPTNYGVRDVRLSKQSLSKGAELFVHATIDATRPDEQPKVVEIHAQNASGTMVKAGQRTVEFGEGARPEVRFLLRDLEGPVAHGLLKLVSSDPLEADDVRYFTVRVAEPPRVLLVSPDELDAAYWQAALSPPSRVEEGTAAYLTDWVPPEDLDDVLLDGYESVCLINVPELADAEWEKLEEFVTGGGGLAVFLGNAHVDPTAYETEAAKRLLPARLLGQVMVNPPATLDLSRLSHPLLARFEDFGTGDLSVVDVYRRWSVEPRAGSNVVAPYTDAKRSPALLERPVGRGRVVMLTTAIDLPPESQRRRAWSHLPYAGWSFVVFADQTMRYLGRQGRAQLNYTAGEDVVLPFDVDPKPTSYVLSLPGFEQRPGEIDEDARSLVLRDADQLGHYDVTSGDEAIEWTLGFSVNPDAGESEFERMTEADLDETLGEGRYALARDVSALERIVVRGRIGQEVFPFVLAIVIAAFCGEHFVANRFYESDQALQHQ